MTKSLARYDNTCKKNRIQRRVYNDETAYNDASLEFFWSVITTKFDDVGQTARFRRKHI